MRLTRAIIVVSLWGFFACSSSTSDGDNWVQEPIRKWPDIALSSEVDFGSKVYTDYASGFLIDTGKDTLAITSKQLMVAFVALRITTVDFQDKLKVDRYGPVLFWRGCFLHQEAISHLRRAISNLCNIHHQDTHRRQ